MEIDGPDIKNAAQRIVESTEPTEPKGFGTLSESLYQFAGTPLESFLHDKLVEHGIDPRTYDTSKDLNYLGLPMSTGETDSLIIQLVDDEINAGNILAIPKPTSYVRQTGNDRWASPGDIPKTANQIRFAPQTVSRFTRITTGFSNEVLINARTREIVGYTLDLEGDGGQKGFALASSDVIELRSQDTNKVLTGDDIIQLEEARRARTGKSPLSLIDVSIEQK